MIVNVFTISMCIFLALIHGDIHFTTVDGLELTFNGYGEYVLLKSLPLAPIFVRVQCRTMTPQKPDHSIYSASILV